MSTVFVWFAVVTFIWQAMLFAAALGMAKTRKDLNGKWDRIEFNVVPSFLLVLWLVLALVTK